MSLTPATLLVEQTRDALEGIGYSRALLVENYSFSDLLGPQEETRRVALAAHAQEPTSYRTACLGVVETDTNSPQEIDRYRALGAPELLSIHAQGRQCSLWTLPAAGPPRRVVNFPASDLAHQITQRGAQWGDILRAKNVAFPQTSPQLDLFDAGLIPAIEAVVHRKLNELLSVVVAQGQEVYQRHDGETDFRALFRLIFRLIAAKVLGDRGYPGDWLDADTGRVLERVNAFYFPTAPAEPDMLDAPTRNRVWDTIRAAFHFQNISVEALAYVYENTFVDKVVRQTLGTHATPYEIAEFAVSHLPIQDLARDERTIFEPFCGAAPFLVAARSRLRGDLPGGWTAAQRHEYFKQMLSGMEVDAFAREIALYSLILADYPNPNGWDIAEEDVFAAPDLDTRLASANVILCNPPYGPLSEDQRQSYGTTTARKEIEALRRVLQHPPQMLAFILPLSYRNGRSYRELRQKIEAHYGSVDVIGFPDTAFKHSKAETVLLLASGAGRGPASPRFVSLPATEYASFRHTRRIDWAGRSLSRVWPELSTTPTLSSVVDAHRGVEYEGFNAADPRFVSPVEKSGYTAGLLDAKSDVQPYVASATRYLTTLVPFRAGAQWDWTISKVIAPAARLSMGPWVTAATIDYDGLLCTQNFHGIWGKGGPNVPPLEVIAAILNGPVANAWIASLAGKRHVQKRYLDSVPLPRLSQAAMELITRYVDRYISRDGDAEALLKIDAAVLDGYDLSREAERDLLAWFAGARRPGVPGFTGYGSDFDRARQEYRHDLAQAELGQRHQALVEKTFLGGLTTQEEQEKERLRRAIDEDSAPFYETALQGLAGER